MGASLSLKRSRMNILSTTFPVGYLRAFWGRWRIDALPQKKSAGHLCYAANMERRHPKLERISFNPEQCEGKPCIRGLRMPVATLVGYLASGMSKEEILKEWPQLEADDIQQALAYAAWSVGEKVLEVA